MTFIASTIRTFAFVATLTALSALQVLADSGDQTRPTATINSVDGQWTGVWKGNNYVYDAALRLSVGPANAVEGAIVWTLRETANPALKPKIGRTATEHIRGQFDPANRLLTFEGFRKDDPEAIIGLDYYRLAVGDNYRTIGGVTRSGGQWYGEIVLRR